MVGGASTRVFHGLPVRACFSPPHPEHVSFIRDVASLPPPQHLHCLINMLKCRGETIVDPTAPKGLIPLAIPLSRNLSGTLTALLRWPTAPSGMEMPVVEVHKHGVRLVAKNVDKYIHRLLIEEDFRKEQGSNSELFEASAEAGDKLYRRGSFTESGIGSIDSYLLRKVDVFPDVLERKVIGHLDQGDQVSALVTGEYYTRKEHFPGFAQPNVFYAEIMLKVGREREAKDAARMALKSPWWTLGCRYEDVARIAQWDDEQIEFIREKVSEEGKQEDLKKGKELAQVVLDQAAFLMDLASIDATWDEMKEEIAQCYQKAGLHDIARFISYRG